MNPVGTDRGGQRYFVRVDRETYAAMIISPTRQIRKALHVSGRQWKKLYKQARRATKTPGGPAVYKRVERDGAEPTGPTTLGGGA